MATVTIQKRERKNRNSYVVYYKDPATGRKKYYKTFQRQRDSQHAANDLRALLDAGKTSEIRKSKVRPNLLSLEEAVEFLTAKWKERLKKDELRAKTYEDYCNRAGLLTRKFGRRLLCEIPYEEILKYRDQIAKEFSNVTSNRSLFILKQVFKHGLELSAVRHDPVAAIPYLSEKGHQRNKFLVPEELDKLIEASQQIRSKYFLPALIYLGAEHGASRQEALSLKWSDINFDFEGVGLIRFMRSKNGRERTEYLMPRTK